MTAQLACWRDCIDKGKIFCPHTGFTKGSCFEADYFSKSRTSNDYDRDRCSDAFDQISVDAESKKRMKYFSCMHEPDCAPSRYWVPQDEVEKTFQILPETKGSDGKTLYFRWRTVCNYEVSFPGDADYGDEIELKFLYLGNTKAVVSLAKELKAGSKDQAVYGFDHQVNRKAGVLKFPFPLKAYVTLKQYRFLNYRPSYFKVAMQMAKAKGG